MLIPELVELEWFRSGTRGGQFLPLDTGAMQATGNIFIECCTSFSPALSKSALLSQDNHGRIALND